MKQLGLFAAGTLTAVNRSTRTMRPMSPRRMSSRQLWRRDQTNRRSRQWYILAHPYTPRCVEGRPPDSYTEEDPLHNAQRRSTSRPPHAHNTIRHALQVEAAEEIDVSIPRSVPEARRPGKAATGMDLGVVCTDEGTIDLRISNTLEAMPFVSISRPRTNTCEGIRSALCKNATLLGSELLTNNSEQNCGMLSLSSPFYVSVMHAQ